MALLEKVKDDLEDVAGKIVKTAAWGFLILGGILILQKVLGLTWNFSVNLGLPLP